MSGGSLTGTDHAPKGYREALKGSLRMVGNHSEKLKAEGACLPDTDRWAEYENET